MQMNRFFYIYPPRPVGAIEFKSEYFESLKAKGWVGQMKLNGQRNLLYVRPDGEIELWNRHREKHRNFVMPPWLNDQIKSTLNLSEGKWTVLDGELLHAKDSTTKNIMYFWDVLVYNSEYLLNTSYQQRYDLLTQNIIPIAGLTPTDEAIKISDNLWVAYNIPPSGWDECWKLTSKSYVEGLVFKNLQATLKPGFNKENNGDWLIRCRKPKNNTYSF